MLTSLFTLQMLLAAQSVFSKSRHQRATGSRTLVDQLLLILSDGRGVFSEGSTASGNSIFKMRIVRVLLFHAAAC